MLIESETGKKFSNKDKQIQICYEDLSKLYGLNCTKRPIYLKNCQAIHQLFTDLDHNGDNIITKEEAAHQYSDKVIDQLFNI